MKGCAGGPVEEVPASVIAAETLAALTELYGHGPPGRFLRGQHGITHFRLKEPKPSPQRSPIAVLSHGTGTESDVFEGPVVDGLVAAGWRVLSYDFFGHGWSVANETFLKYDKEVFLTQVKELLDHVLLPQEPVDLWVGHSTGGAVGIEAALTRMRPFQNLALIAPSVWLTKTFINRVGDSMSGLFHSMASRYKFLRQRIVEDGYKQHADGAFGKEGGAYLFPELHAATKEFLDRKFKLHPQVAGAITGIIAHFLRGDLLEGYQAAAQELLSKGAESWGPRVLLLWGKFDTVVPFTKAPELVAWASTPGRVTFVPLHAGHELLYEMPKDVAKEILKFIPAPASRL